MAKAAACGLGRLTDAFEPSKVRAAAHFGEEGTGKANMRTGGYAKLGSRLAFGLADFSRMIMACMIVTIMTMVVTSVVMAVTAM
jgi:hypothetical protein